MPRVLIPCDAVRRQQITITDPDRLHHLLHVLRVKTGDRLECFDGQGRGYAGTVTRCARRAVVLKVTERVTEPPAPFRLILAQALIKPERFEWVIQKATELGVERITPLVTARTVVRLARGQIERKLARWRRLAEEASQQCGRLTVPTINPPQPFDRFVPTLKDHAGVVMPTLAVASPPLKDQVTSLNGAASVVALIGPEGDFTREETLLAQRHGARLVSLGRLTLRAETAAIATLAILSYALAPG